MPEIDEGDRAPSPPKPFAANGSYGVVSSFGIAARGTLVAAFLIFIARQLPLSESNRAFDWQILMAIAFFQIPMLAALLTYAWRHAILVRTPPVPLSTAAEAILLSATLNLLVPGRLSEVVKATYLRSRIGIPVAHSLAAILIERLLDIVVVGAIAATGVASLLRIQTLLVISLPIVALLTLLFMRPLAVWLASALSRRSGLIWDVLKQQCHHTIGVLRPDIAARAVVLTFVSWSMHFVALVVFFRQISDGGLPIPDVALVFGAIVLAAAIPGLPAGLGTFEAAVVFVLQSRGFEFSQALSIAVSLHIAELVLSAIFGPIIILRRSIGVGQLTRDAISALRALRSGPP